MTFSPQSSCSRLIDLQARLVPAIFDAPRPVGRVRLPADIAQRLKVPVHVTEQNRAGLGPTVREPHGFAFPAFQKQHVNATRKPSWPGVLPESCEDIVVCGTEAHVCVLQSVRRLLEQGRRITVVNDAVGSRTPADRDAGLHRMKRHGAELATSEMAFEWFPTSSHPRFREVLAIIKNVGSETQTNEHD